MITTPSPSTPAIPVPTIPAPIPAFHPVNKLPPKPGPSPQDHAVAVWKPTKNPDIDPYTKAYLGTLDFISGLFNTAIEQTNAPATWKW